MKLFHHTYGTGYPVIILHGLFGCSDNWITIAKRLSDNYTIYLLDQRNHGKSPHHPVMTYDSMSEDLYEFLTDYRIKQVHLIGHSMGGKTAMHFACEYPHRVKSMTILDISPKNYPVSHDRVIDMLTAINLADIDSRNEADRRLANMIGRKDLRQFLLKNLQSHEDGHFSWRLNLPVLTEHMNEISSDTIGDKKYNGPVLFIRGGESDYILPEDIPQIKYHFPASKVYTIEGASHWLHGEKPDAVYAAISTFLKKVDLKE
jgi:esterase